jgi:hypothetical protein
VNRIFSFVSVFMKKFSVNSLISVIVAAIILGDL